MYSGCKMHGVTDGCLILKKLTVNAILDPLLVGYVSGTRDSRISHAQNMRLVDDADGDDGKQSGTTRNKQKAGHGVL